MGREWYFNWGSKSSSKKGGGTTNKGVSGGGGGGRGGGERRSGMPQVATAAAAVAASGGCMNAVLHMFDFNHFHLCLHPNSNGSYIQDDSVPLKGVEAPRNSLESIHEDEKDNYYSLNTHVHVQMKTNRKDTGLKLVQAPRAKVEDTMSQSSSSPSARTPTLVARLMGLDILPESTNTTPRSSSSYNHITSSTTTPSRASKTRTKSHSCNNDILGSHSRPKTPNSSSSPASSQRRKSMDMVENHRLSLQINKENSIVKEMESSRPSCSAINTKRRDGRKYYNEEENKSPGYYARQIMKQVKETVSRRVGADITNTISTQRDRDRDQELRRDEHLLSTTQPTTKPKKVRNKEPSSLLISSPKLVKSSETSKKSLETNLCDAQEVVEKVQLKTVTTRENEKKIARFHGHDCYEKTNMELEKLGGAKQNSKMSRKSYDFIRNKKDEQFVRPSTRASNCSSIDKKCKKTPLSSDLVHASVPSIVPLKKDSSASSSQTPTKLVEIQEGTSKAQVSKLINSISTTMNTTIQLPHGPTQQRYEKVQQEATHKPTDPMNNKDGTSTSTSTSTSTAECQYISRILKCTGIDRNTPISFTRWFSYSHPLNPTIFETLEALHYPTVTNPDLTSLATTKSSSLEIINPIKLVNRKLIFHLVDEILADILKPYIKIKPFNRGHNQTRLQINGFQLVKTLCTKIRSFPSKDCKTLQDIDALVEKDMPKKGVMCDNSMAFEDESEDIVSEIEGDIVDSLVHEIALFLL